MAELLAGSLERDVDASELELTNVNFTDEGKKVRFAYGGRQFEYDLTSGELENQGQARGRGRGRGGRGRGRGRGGAQQQDQDDDDVRNFADDKKAFVFAKDHNLYYGEADGGGVSRPADRV